MEKKYLGIYDFITKIRLKKRPNGINEARKSFNEARINYNSHEASKTFFLDLMMMDKCFNGAI